jgi:hypothetical protein
MKTLLQMMAVVIAALLLSGCLTYQHVKLASNSALTDQSEFKLENDSVRIVYSFSGLNGPIHMEIFNKLSKPFYVDWRKSALIRNGESTTLWKDESRVSATTTEYKVYPEDDVINSVSKTNSTVVRKDHITYIPPQSNVAVNSFILRSKLFTVPEQAGEKVAFHTHGGKRKAMKYSFSKVDSPLKFRIFLSFSMDDNVSSSFHTDNEFWVQQYLDTRTTPGLMGLYPPNQFYIMK